LAILDEGGRSQNSLMSSPRKKRKRKKKGGGQASLQKKIGKKEVDEFKPQPRGFSLNFEKEEKEEKETFLTLLTQGGEYAPRAQRSKTRKISYLFQSRSEEGKKKKRGKEEEDLS